MSASLEMDRRLWGFAMEGGWLDDGPLAMALVITRLAKTARFPLDVDRLAASGRLEPGAARETIRVVLLEYGSRGGLSVAGAPSAGLVTKARQYVALLNDLQQRGTMDLAFVESWWVARVREHLANRPLTLRLDPSGSPDAALADLLAQAERRREPGRASKLPLVLRHLAGAALEAAVEGPQEVEGAGPASAAFVAGDLAVHVIASPGEATVAWCASALGRGLRPVIVTLSEHVGAARWLAERAGIAHRVEVWALGRWLAASALERDRFEPGASVAWLRGVVRRYNDRVARAERDPSLRIELLE